MKFKNKILKSTIIASLLFGAIACDDDEFNKETRTLGNEIKSVSEILNDTPEFSSFMEAVSLLEYDEDEGTSYLDAFGTTVSLGNGVTEQYTVLAPVNSALDAMGTMTAEETENFLLNHVIISVTPDFSTTFESGYVLSSALGPNDTSLSVFVNADGVFHFNATETVDGLIDMGATNGTVHAISAGLIPPTILDHVNANPDFSSLAEAIELADLEDTFDGAAINTLIAPTNAAFEAFLADTNGAFGWATLADIPVDVLASVLSYHVTADNNVDTDLDGETFETLQGESFSIAGTVVNDASFSSANLETLNIQGINGVIHSSDKVLIPDVVFQDVLDATVDIVARADERGFTTFLAAAEMVGLTDALMTDELTAFMPNNGAFEVFLLTIENFESLDDFDTPEELDLLRSVIEYHLVAGGMLVGDLVDPLTTVQGDDITVSGTTLTPSHEFAPAGNIAAANNNIGATNGYIHEIDNVLVSDLDAAALGYPLPPSGEPVYGYEIFHDELNPAFWIGGWTTPDFANTEQVLSGLYSIRVDYAGDDGFQIGGAGEDLTAYSFVNASIYSENGTSVTFILNEQWDDGQTVAIPAGEWTDVAIPITNISNGTTTLDQFVIRDASLTANTVYIDQVGLDVTLEEVIPEFGFDIFTEELNPAFWIGGWTAPDFANTEQVKTGLYSIRVDYAGDDGFQIGGAGEDLSAYTLVKASIYSEAGTSVTFILNEQWDDGQTVAIPAGEWTAVEIPITNISNGTTSLDQFVIRDASLAANTVYLDDIGLD